MQISDAEWTVMNAVWDGQPIEAQAVIDLIAAQNEWSPATVKTMLHRLVKKRALKAESIGKKYRYRAAVRRGDCIRRASRSFLDRVFGGDAAPALLHIAKNARLTDGEVAQLRALLDKKESKE